jgi:hypothetical protein
MHYESVKLKYKYTTLFMQNQLYTEGIPAAGTAAPQSQSRAPNHRMIVIYIPYFFINHDPSPPTRTGHANDTGASKRNIEQRG